MSAFYSLSDDEDGPVAGPSSPSMLATPRRNKPNDSSAAAYALESPSASPFSRGGGHAGPSTSAGAITPPRRPPAYNRGLSPSLSIRGAAPTAPGPGPPPPLPAITRLQKAWVAERSCPELLPWSDPNGSLRCDEVVDEVCAQVEQQVSILTLLSTDEATSEEEHLRLSLVQLDVERARWLLRAFLRARLSKLEEHPQHYLSLAGDDDDGGPGGAMLVSPLERAYLRKYASIRATHFNTSILDYLPESLRGLADDALDEEPGSSAGGMVSRPDAQGPVFIRCIEDCGSLTMADGETVQLVKGSVHLLSWSGVRALVRADRAELV